MKESTDKIQFTKEPFVEDVGPRKIKSIHFSSFSESEIHKAAEVQVWRGSYYDSTREPIKNGLLDPHMGPANKRGTCFTCHGDFTKCPGHYGCLTLALPVYNVGYLNAVVNILKCICKSCSRILLNERLRLDYLSKMTNPRMDALRKSELVKTIVQKCSTMASNKKAVLCSRCNYVNGVVKKAVGILGIIHDRSKIADGTLEGYASAVAHIKESKGSLNQDRNLNPVKVLSLFENMIDEDCKVLYLSDRPEKFIITSIAVPPNAIRPSVLMDGGAQSNENDITERLKRVIQANACLHQSLLEMTSPYACLAKWDALLIEVAQYINSDVRGVPIALQSQRTLSGFVQRLKGKQGRFRGNLSGKRVEFTGRTVISPDPNLKITEVAIPIHMALKLTYPERVTKHNIEKLRQRVLNGPKKYPGAKIIRSPDGNSWALGVLNKKRAVDQVKCGCIVERHLEDGDIVLFNRQPSLHRMSIMCHRARVMPWRTLRFNESVCNPYNADFDGDEMNMHVPQTEEARTEALMLMGVQNNLCTPKNGEILVASTQDFLTSSFLITRKDTFYDRASFSLMCSYMGDGMDHVDLPTPAILKPVELWTGKQLFNVLLRPNAKMEVYLNFTVEEKIHLKGTGTMCPNDGFVYFRNSELICGQLGKVTLGNGNKSGLYSVLLRDYNAHAAAACMNRLAKLSARWIGNHGFSIGIDDVQPGEKLNNEKIAKISGSYERCNNLIEEYNKGKLTLQPGSDAAQTLESSITHELNDIREATGKVCMAQLHWRNSPLIMSQCGSKGSPINISQMIACVGQQSVGGRRAPNGFIDRSLPHFCRNSKTPDAKGFVANSFYSGLTATEFFFHTMGGREGLVDTAVKTAETGYMSRRLMKSLEDLFIHYDSTVRNASGNIVQFLYGDDAMDPARMEGKDGVPLNFDRLFLKTKATCPPGDQAIYLTPEEIEQMKEERFLKSDTSPEAGCSEAFINSLSNYLEICKDRIRRTREALPLKDDYSGKKDVLEDVALKISGITSKQLQVFLDTCIARYHLKKVEAGTAIGAIGAHSIGEPGTQMTLKTFHFAGVASMNVTLGVPRIKEIINGAKNISTPIVTAWLQCDDNEKVARLVKGRIEKTTLGQVAKRIKIVMTTRTGALVIKLDRDRIEALQLCVDAEIVKTAISQTRRIKHKELDMKALDREKLIITPRFDREKFHLQLYALKNVLPNVVVKGITTVERVVINKYEKVDPKKKGSKNKFNLLVEGMGLQAVMGTSGIDGLRTTSNHIIEVQNTIGIEAARKCIIDEIKFTMGNHGMSIDARHMMLLADLMTFKGEVLGITRFGMMKMKESVLMLASFEKTADHLFNASVTGRDDLIEGVSECIIMGIPMQLGTGILKVRQRIQELPELTYGPDPIIC